MRIVLENNSQTSKKQLSFITLPYKGQQGEQVINASGQLYINIYQIT